MTDVSIICEIASAHCGHAGALKEMLAHAHAADSDWVKVQIYHFGSLVAGENAKFQELRDIELEPREWRDAIRYAGSLRPRVIAEVFDVPSFELVAGDEAVRAFKIPTADLGDKTFVDAICRQGKPVFIGVGGATFDEVDAIVEQVRQYPNVPLVLLHGFQNFPTRLEDSLLARIGLLRARYGCEVGFADHIDADDSELARTVPAMAIAAGASVIEKHMTRDRGARGFDYYSALNPAEFADFVRHMRRASKAIGPRQSTQLTEAELVYRNKMKKFAVLSRPVTHGTVVADAAIEFKRTSCPGMTRNALDSYRARTFAVDLPAGTILSDGQFE